MDERKGMDRLRGTAEQEIERKGSKAKKKREQANVGQESGGLVLNDSHVRQTFPL